MNKLFPILALLFFSCDEDNPVTQNVYGCTDNTACNFNPDATIFDNSCFYAEDWEDECGVCDLDTTNDCVQDDCGVWGGDNSECEAFSSILLTDEEGNVLGYEGDEGYHTNCFEDRSPFWLDFGNNISAPFPNPFSSGISIDIAIETDAFVHIKIIDEEYNDIKIIHNNYMTAGTHALTWDGLNELGNQIPAGFYRFIITYEDDECYVNIKKQAE
ncbi:MAG: hypothetical protein CMG00_01240 [Candidatus Marinimicrobia bacterium]|nr:hypothetical protein [Candidatus Neomarinimicrobiota bacterium]|tara:strand:- start:1334 stop:1978 length:645 start_codon:yes stop_codon:yes gene_type:complete